MLGALLDLAGEVEGGRDDEVGVRAPYLDVRVEALDVDLGRGDGLLADLEALAEAGEFWGGLAEGRQRMGWRAGPAHVG